MPITDDEVATIRTLLGESLDEFKRLHGQLDREATKYTYTALILGAFATAVERRFGRQTPASKIIEFVGEARSRLDEPDELDPVIAERLIRSVYTGETLDQVDCKTEAGHQFILMAALVGDMDLDDAGLEEFMAEARKLGDQILGDD